MDKRNESDNEVLSKKEMKDTKGGAAALSVAKEPKLQVDKTLEPLLKEPALPSAASPLTKG